MLRLEELSAEERAATVKAMADALPADRKARAAAIRDGKILYPSVVDEIDPNDPDILAALNT
ncbi:MAG: hypothetical protein JNJ45_07970 [Chthonomonas sp.]|nr:hypothetical protein [Chthonomonas sp.]